MRESSLGAPLIIQSWDVNSVVVTYGAERVQVRESVAFVVKEVIVNDVNRLN